MTEIVIGMVRWTHPTMGIGTAWSDGDSVFFTPDSAPVTGESVDITANFPTLDIKLVRNGPFGAKRVDGLRDLI